MPSLELMQNSNTKGNKRRLLVSQARFVPWVWREQRGGVHRVRSYFASERTEPAWPAVRIVAGNKRDAEAIELRYSLHSHRALGPVGGGNSNSGPLSSGGKMMT